MCLLGSERSSGGGTPLYVYGLYGDVHGIVFGLSVLNRVYNFM